MFVFVSGSDLYNLEVTYRDKSRGAGDSLCEDFHKCSREGKRWEESLRPEFS